MMGGVPAGRWTEGLLFDGIRRWRSRRAPAKPAARDMQEPFIRHKEIDPAKYYPEGYHPELMTEWPVDSDLVVPVDVLPETMFESMGENWRDRQAYKKHISELTAD